MLLLSVSPPKHSLHFATSTFASRISQNHDDTKYYCSIFYSSTIKVQEEQFYRQMRLCLPFGLNQEYINAFVKHYEHRFNIDENRYITALTSSLLCVHLYRWYAVIFFLSNLIFPFLSYSQIRAPQPKEINNTMIYSGEN